MTGDRRQETGDRIEELRPKPLLSGIVYGHVVFWLVIVGALLGLTGMAGYLFEGSQFFDADVLLKELLAGRDVRTIWARAADSEVLRGRWYLSCLACGDGLAMLGISICCWAGVVGIWAALLGMLVGKERPRMFALFGLIVALILSLSATGVISLR